MRLKVIALISIALFWSAPALTDTTVRERLAADQPSTVVAHRTAELSGHPENSLEWIADAINRGVDIVNINPQLTADGHYVLMHDGTLNRTTNVEGVFPEGAPGGPTRSERFGKDYVRDYTLEEIKKLRLVGDLANTLQQVPTLEEALNLIDGRLLVLMGLKSYEIESLASALEGRDVANLLFRELFASGTDQSKLRDLVDVTGIPTSVTLFRTQDALGDLEDVASQLGSRMIMVGVRSKQLTPEFVERAKELGLRILISGRTGSEDFSLAQERDPGPWLSVIEQGFDASTDQPILLLEAMGR